MRELESSPFGIESAGRGADDSFLAITLTDEEDMSLWLDSSRLRYHPSANIFIASATMNAH